jgi:hypothetical protein
VEQAQFDMIGRAQQTGPHGAVLARELGFDVLMSTIHCPGFRDCLDLGTGAFAGDAARLGHRISSSVPVPVVLAGSIASYDRDQVIVGWQLGA